MDKVKNGSRRAWRITKDNSSASWRAIKRGARKTKKTFERHPKSNNQSYFRHLVKSWKACGFAMWVGFQYLVHGCFPFWFEHNCDVTEGEEGYGLTEFSTSDEIDISESSLDSM